MNFVNLRDTLVRAFKTMLQSAIAYLSAQLMIGIDITSEEALKTLMIGLIGALLGAVSNLHVEEEA